MIRKFSPTKQKFFKKKIFGFDIETYDDNKKFLLCSIVGKDYKKTFYDVDSFLKEIKTKKCFHNSVLFATNLSFDFFGIFWNIEDTKNFTTLFRGSNLLHAKTFYKDEGFTYEEKNGRKYRKSLEFLDTMNYASLSVEKMGKVIGIDKLEKPDCLGYYPRNKKELKEMVDYNLRDSEISFEFMKFFIDAVEDLGATFKMTIASTSMSLFKNKHLKGSYFTHDVDTLKEIFESYYGGRTEVFCRGYFKNANYYDYNSLYPSVMKENIFPDPNFLRTTMKNTIEYIKNYEGVSLVDIEVFKTDIPILPYRKENGRLLFPYGSLKGWYTHIELRKAIEEGACVKKVYKSHYYTKTCRPFQDYVTILYNKRLEYKKKGSPMELVSKLIMNTLYGKFGERFQDKQTISHKGMFEMTEQQLKKKKIKDIEMVGDYVLFKQDVIPSAHCIPIWATYVTAYGRLKLYEALKEHKVYYCDTDSIITKEQLRTSDSLGDFKLEMRISEGILVRPKFYGIKDRDKHESFCSDCNTSYDEFLKVCPRCKSHKIRFNHHVKIKGLGRIMNFYELAGLIMIKHIEYDKFTKFKEALRRHLIPNEKITVHKEFSLDDEKRSWPGKFMEKDSWEESIAIQVVKR